MNAGKSWCMQEVQVYTGSNEITTTTTKCCVSSVCKGVCITRNMEPCYTNSWWGTTLQLQV